MVFGVLCSFGQGNGNGFKLEGTEPETIELDQLISENTEIFPFEKKVNKLYGLAISGKINLVDETSSVRVILITKNFREYMVYETNHLLAETMGDITINEICEETCLLNNLSPYSMRIEISNASIHLTGLTYNKSVGIGKDIVKTKKEKKKQQNAEKIDRINKNLKEKGKNWIAGHTGVSELSYEEKKKLFGQSKFPAGFEYYVGGVISTSTSDTQLKSASSSPYVDEWDWRDRHGKNWITPVTDQLNCGSCWAFAATGAVEAVTNLYYNQQLNLDLSEQDLLSCSGAGDCIGGSPARALDYIANEGIVDEASFIYTSNDVDCNEKMSNPMERMRISGRIDFGFSPYEKNEDNLKSMIINLGPLSSGLYDWNHAMVLVGYKVVKEGDIFYYRDLSLTRNWKTVETGDPLIGKTVWIYKNSWGYDFGDEGYVYVETPITNVGWTIAIKLPIVSEINEYNVTFKDADGDGYYWWGLGPKPATCGGPDTPDGNDADPSLGPIDEYGNYTLLNGAPVVSISANKTNIESGEQIIFTDNSTNNPDLWEWTFDGGNPAISSIKNPVVSYNSVGEFDVTLKVTNAQGTSTKTFLNFVNVQESVIQPDANFSTDKTIINPGEEIAFKDLSLNNPTTWLWNFEEGNPGSSNLQNPIVSYTKPGLYAVSLMVTNDAGSSIKEINDFITVKEEISDYCSSRGNASRMWISSVGFGSLNNTSSSSGESGYQDFTGHVFSIEENTTQKVILSPGFSGPGKKVCWNIWIDYNGDKDFDDVNELVFSSKASSKTITGEIKIPSGLNISTRMRISMKQNSPSSQCEIFPAGEVEDYTIVFQKAVPVAPVAEFSANNTNITVEESISFTDLSENDPTQWEWSFPGGNPSFSNARNPVVSYSSVGEFDVSLTVTKPGFAPVTKTKKNYVVINEKSISEYCFPVGINSNSDYIKNVSFGSFSNSAGGNGYSLNSTPIYLIPGKNYDISLSPADGTNRNFWRLWIDFNNDGDFEDSGENLLALNNKKGTITSSFIIPAYANEATRMRIAMRNSKAPSSCDNNYYGEVEDYKVSFENQAASFGVIMTSKSESVKRDILKIYPNPTNQFLNIELNSVKPGAHYTIFDLRGKELISKNITDIITRVEVNSLVKGMYLVVIVNDGHVSYEKFVKE